MPADTVMDPKILVRRNALLCLMGIAVLAIVSYWSAIGGGYVYDDKAVVEDIAVFQRPVQAGDLFTRAYYDEFRERTYRPVASLSFFMDSLLWHMNPMGAHLFNVVLHILVSWLVFGVIYLLVPRMSAAFFGGALFAAHPLHVEAVALVSNREDLLCALFWFAAFSLYLTWRRRRRNSTPFAILFTFCALGAMFSKEMAASLPVAVALHAAAFRERDRSLRHALVDSRVFIGSAAAVVLFFVILRYTVLRNPVGEVGYPGGGAWAALMTMPGVFFRYIKLMVVPHPLCAEYIIPTDYKFFGAGGLFLIAMTAYLASGWYAMRRAPLLGFALLFPFAAWLPVSNIIPFGATMAERYAYLPSFAASLFLGIAAARMERRRAALVLPAAILLVFAGLTFARGHVWRDDMSLWSSTAQCAPNSSRAQHNLGNALAASGRYVEALKRYDMAAACPDVLAPHELAYNRGLALMALGRTREASDAFDESLRIKPDNEYPHYQLGAIDEKNGKNDLAAAHFKKAVEINPRNTRSYYIAARHKMQHAKNRKDLQQAYYWLNYCLKYEPYNADAYAASGYTLMRLGHKRGAVEALRTALYLDPENSQAVELLQSLNITPSPADKIIVPMSAAAAPWKAWLILAFIFFAAVTAVMYVYYLAME